MVGFAGGGAAVAGLPQTAFRHNIRAFVLTLFVGFGTFQYNLDTSALRCFLTYTRGHHRRAATHSHSYHQRLPGHAGYASIGSGTTARWAKSDIPCSNTGFLRVFGDPAPSGKYVIDKTFQQLITSLLQVGLILSSILIGPFSRYWGRRAGFFVVSAFVLLILYLLGDAGRTIAIYARAVLLALLVDLVIWPLAGAASEFRLPVCLAGVCDWCRRTPHPGVRHNARARVHRSTAPRHVERSLRCVTFRPYFALVEHVRCLAASMHGL